MRSGFSPDHFIHYPCVALDDFHHLGAHVLIHIVGHGDAMVAIGVHHHCCIYRLQEAVGVDAGNEETTFVQGLGAFRASTDTHRREGVSHAGEEAALLRKGAAVAHHGEGVHLQAVVVVEAQRLVLNNTRVKFESTGLETFAAAGMTAVENGHVVFLCHGVDGIE